MKYFACRANNWRLNDYPKGELGYAVILSDLKDNVLSIKWFPDELFERVFGGELEGTF